MGRHGSRGGYSLLLEVATGVVSAATAGRTIGRINILQIQPKVKNMLHMISSTFT